MNTRRPQIVVLLFLLPILSYSQNTIEPYIGYSIDINNKKPLLQLTPGLQYPVINKKVYQMVIGVRGGLPLYKNAGTEVAYSADPSLPLTVTTGYKTQFYSIAATLGNRFRVSRRGDKNIFSLFLTVGLISHKINVWHESYDMEKYTILNPHKNLNMNGVFLSGGIHYKRKVGGGYCFSQIDISSPPIVKGHMNYVHESPVPLAINAGYIIAFKKSKK